MPRRDPRTLRTRTGKRGGKRAGSGRKLAAAAELVARLPAEKIDDAEYAISLYVSVMRNGKKPLRMRLAAADWVAKRILGMPKQQQEIDQNINMTIETKLEKFREQIKRVYGPLANARAGAGVGSDRRPDAPGGDAGRPD